MGTFRSRMNELRSTMQDWLVNRPIRDRPADTVDERDTMFARAAREPGTQEYDGYYERRPENRAVDDRIRQKPHLGSPDALYHDREIARETEEYFEAIEDIDPDPETVAAWTDELDRADTPEAVLEALAQDHGAVDVGFTQLPEEYVYSHKGRFDANYGEPVSLDHEWAVVFLVEMDRKAMNEAPKPPVLRESARQYYRAAVIAKTIGAVLRNRGFEAEPQYDAHYEVVLPPLAVEAGLGELGRNNILVADKYGSRVRIGAVTTTRPLQNDEPISLGIERFCRSCNRCASTCPARALEPAGKESVRGTEKWPTDPTRCYSFWRQVGTDCGMCMNTCPFSHENTWLHNTTRQIIKHAPWLAPLFVWVDKGLYSYSVDL
ncbi:4Fe-4S dicluster domain-containing protein [Halodesulfurarchaeum sp.]|uniref:4Fe-4S dicluster domain-containing protein n=1 Tax=Halodesulfurarchaeum sp. TaxID=1980530 RepID=UPI002FC2AF2B